jgi:ectoine hydroxylase-related dioxygenase (phytanoyl-CoA dioxygenase family)
MKTNNHLEIINKLKRDGFVVIEDFFDIDFCKSAKNEIDKMISESAEKSFSEEVENTGGDIRFFKFEKYSKTAKLFADNNFLNEIVNSYRNENLCTHFVLAGKVSKRSTQTNSGGGWHRDSDFIQLKAMVYLTNVTSDNGPFLFYSGSKPTDLKRRKHKLKNHLLYYIKKILKGGKLLDPRYDDIEIEHHIKLNNNKLHEITGKAGTVVLFDSSYIHRGKNLLDGERYTFTNYYFSNSEDQFLKTNKTFGSYFC